MTSTPDEKATPEVCEKDLTVIAMADFARSQRTLVDSVFLMPRRDPGESASCSVQILKKRQGRPGNLPVVFDGDFSMAMRRFRDECNDAEPKSLGATD